MYSLQTSKKLRELAKFMFMAGLFGLSALFGAFYFADNFSSFINVFFVFFLVSLAVILKFLGDYFDITLGIRSAELAEELKKMQAKTQKVTPEYVERPVKPRLKYFSDEIDLDGIEKKYRWWKYSEYNVNLNYEERLEVQKEYKIACDYYNALKNYDKKSV